ncbi:centromere protein S isoform 1-T1 [Menidia menidia]
MSLDADETRQRLKAAVHYTVGRLCQRAGQEHRREFSRQAVAAIAETAFRQCDVFAKDLEAFARHAKRSIVSAEDVKLAARRSTALVSATEMITQQYWGDTLPTESHEERDDSQQSFDVISLDLFFTADS